MLWGMDIFNLISGVLSINLFYGQSGDTVGVLMVSKQGDGDKISILNTIYFSYRRV